MSERKRLESDKKRARSMMEAIPPDFEGLRQMRDEVGLDEALKFDIEQFLERSGERTRPTKKGQEFGDQKTDDQVKQEEEQGLSQDEIDSKDIDEAVKNNNLTALKEIAKRKLSDANRKKVEAAIAKLEPAVLKNQQANEAEKTNKTTSTTATPPASLPPAIKKYQYEKYADPGYSALRPPRSAAVKKEGEPKAPPEKSYLTPYAWRQVKSAAWSLFKYTGMYIAPPVLGRLAYLYALEQPEGSVLRTGAEVFNNLPFAKMTEKERQSLIQSLSNFQTATSAATRLFTQALPDYLTGYGPGQEYGPMLRDIITRHEAEERQEFNDTIMRDYEANLRRSVRRRRNSPPDLNIGKKRRTGLATRSRSMNDMFFENVENTVTDYATRSAGDLASDILTTGLQAISPILQDTDMFRRLSDSISSGMSLDEAFRRRSDSAIGSLGSIVSNRRSTQSSLGSLNERMRNL